MVTGKAETDDMMAAFSLGANDYVTKPVDLRVLRARAATQIERKRGDEQLRKALQEIGNLNHELRMECARRAEAEACALDLAYHDAVTGLCNRIRFSQELTAGIAALVEGRDQLALLCLGLDGFKQVNDTLGHQVGDELLMAVADRLRGCVRDSDTVARLGGDEFAIIVPCMKDQVAAAELANRVIEVLRLPFWMREKEANVGCSIGIAFATSARVDPDLLFREADQALYSAKADGRGTWRVASPSQFGRAKTVLFGDVRTGWRPTAYSSCAA
jgi:diguanylate cyclase (GGDEF)-like protein